MYLTCNTKCLGIPLREIFPVGEFSCYWNRSLPALSIIRISDSDMELDLNTNSSIISIVTQRLEGGVRSPITKLIFEIAFEPCTKYLSILVISKKDFSQLKIDIFSSSVHFMFHAYLYIHRQIDTCRSYCSFFYFVSSWPCQTVSNSD